MKAITFISSTLLISAVSIGVGMLFAPRKGSRTRRKISELNDEYNNLLSDKFDDFVDLFLHPLENLDEKTQRIAKKITKK